MEILNTMIMPLLTGLAGFIMQSFSESRKALVESFRLKIQLQDKADESADKASARTSNRLDKASRFLLMVTILVGAVWMLVYVGLHPDTLNVVEKQVIEPRGGLFGFIGSMLGTNPGKTIYHTIQGFYYSEELKIGFMSILTFYLGRHAAK